ncbi:HNH endonuclease [Bacillus sp. TH22]|uniref:HNH endonuclease n=1 Tax=Bacillus sp. TH22 TaxID=2796388 RepID=UPI00191320C3|nr:HNH endonuclease [Bacillus sp. TH22]MBK5449110.1 HNH endonuclease [Bacillus sp. TH22]
MTYYLKKLGHQELGSITEPGNRASRGRYIYISKDKRVLSFFPPLSKYVKNDSSLLPIIPLYTKNKEKIYCNYIYHNDKYNGSTAVRPRDEYRIYSNNALEMSQYFFEAGDIIALKKEEIIEKTSQTVYYLEIIKPIESAFYQKCKDIIDASDMRRNNAIYEGVLDEMEAKIEKLSTTPLQVVVDSSVTDKIKNSEKQIEDLFNANSFRDFTMVAYQGKCAVTRSVIKCNNFLNLEAAHIKPKSHDGSYRPNNGLALSRDIHWAFDKGFFTLNDDYTLKVHPSIESDFLQNYNGKQIYIPEEDFFKPSIESIHYHRDNVFGLFLTSGKL